MPATCSSRRIRPSSWMPSGSPRCDRTALDEGFPQRMKSVSRALVLLVVIVATVGCDRVTKHLAATALAEQPGRFFLSGTVRLQYAENQGAFLGVGSDWPRPARIAVFSVGNTVLLICLGLVAVRLHWRGEALLGFALFAAGAASNLADRIVRGSVIDFLNIGIGPVRTGIFNVADVAILIGAIVVALAGAAQRRR